PPPGPCFSVVASAGVDGSATPPTTRNRPLTDRKLAGKINPPRRLYVTDASFTAVPPADGTLQIVPLASVTTKPEGVCVMLSGTCIPVANTELAAETEGASSGATRSARTSTPIPAHTPAWGAVDLDIAGTPVMPRYCSLAAAKPRTGGWRSSEWPE